MKLTPLAFSAVLPLLAAGCVNLSPEPDLTRHFTLSSQAEPGNPAPAVANVTLAPVSVPDYLKQSGIVSRRNSDELRIAETARWAEPLESGIARVVSETLSSGKTPSNPTAPKMILAIQVREFAVFDDGAAIFEATAVLRDAESGALLLSHHERSSARVESGEDAVREEVAAMSRALGSFAANLAARIR